MVFRVLLVLALLWIHSLANVCQTEDVSREAVLSWFREQVLESLGLEEPPMDTVQRPDGDLKPQVDWPTIPRTSHASRVEPKINTNSDTSQIILFPTPDSSCDQLDSASEGTPMNNLTYHFRPSMNSQNSLVTSVHFWFHVGQELTSNFTATVFILTSAQPHHRVAAAPSQISSDGWRTYIFDQTLLKFVSEGPFLLQMHCQACQCHTSEVEKMPFLHLHAKPHGRVRSPRSAPVVIPWSPAAIDLLQRPSQERPEHSDCHREELQISFEQLGWDNWIIHPKVITFYYCHGNCSDRNEITAVLGITQCCAPVPGSMKSLRITTTSDGGYSFKHEILPNIIPEECTCI